MRQDGGIKNCHSTLLSLPWHEMLQNFKCDHTLSRSPRLHTNAEWSPWCCHHISSYKRTHASADLCLISKAGPAGNTSTLVSQPYFPECSLPLTWIHSPPALWKTVMNKWIVTVVHVIPHVLYRNKPFSYPVFPLAYQFTFNIDGTMPSF